LIAFVIFSNDDHQRNFLIFTVIGVLPATHHLYVMDVFSSLFFLPDYQYKKYQTGNQKNNVHNARKWWCTFRVNLTQ